MLAELIREQVLRRTRQEVPHAVEVQIEEIEEGTAYVIARAACGSRPSRRRGS